MPLSLEVSDEQLIMKTAEGSDAAFEELMGRYMQVLYSYISLRASESDASDILQETMLAAWRGISEFVGASTFKTWLFAIARRKICDFYRERSRSRNIFITRSELLNEEDESSSDDMSDFDSDIGLDSVEPMTADPVSDISERLDAADAIKSLNKQEREIVFMIFEAGLSYTQISEVTGIPVGTIKSRMSAVKTKLKRFLGEDYDKL